MKTVLGALGGIALLGMVAAVLWVFTDPLTISLGEYATSTHGMDAAQHQYISVEAEDALIEPSFEIGDDQACSNGKYLVVREGCGSAWNKSGTGSATLKLSVPKGGEYTLWMRVKWESGCSGAFGLDLDAPKREVPGWETKRMPEKMFGKDSTLNTWHWLTRYVFTLKAGEQTIRLRNWDDGSYVDKLLLTDDLSYQPTGTARHVCSKDPHLSPHGWAYVPADWKAATTGLVKRTFFSSPAFLPSQTQPYYLGLRWGQAKSARIYFDYVDQNNCTVVHFTRSSVRLLQKKDGVSTCVKEGRIPDDCSRVRVALFRRSEDVLVTVDGRAVLSVPFRKSISGNAAIDVSRGSMISEVDLQPLERIHVGSNFYCTYRPLFEEEPRWRRHGGLTPPKEGEMATIKIGHPWWLDYQISAILSLPEKGAFDLRVNYVDDFNHISIRREGKVLRLSEAVAGVRRVLSSAYIAPGRKRLTVEAIGGEIQLYWDGKLLLRGSSSVLRAGTIRLASDSMKLVVDDIEVWSIDGKSSRMDIPANFAKRRIRVINTVMDQRGATGSRHPGDYRELRSEVELERAIGRPGRPARVLDGQWASFANGFTAVNGFGKTNGYLLGESGKFEERLWSLRPLYGDFDLILRADAAAEAFSIGFLDENDRRHEFRFRPEQDCVELLVDGRVKSTHGFGFEEGWRILPFARRGRSLSIAGIAVDLETAVRPYFAVSKGKVKFDSIEAYVHPSLAYKFSYNQADSLSLSDWEMSPNAKKSHVGGYYGRIRLVDPNGKAVTLSSKRSFADGFAAELVLDDATSGNLSLELKSNSHRYNVQMADDRVFLKANGVLVQQAKLLRYLPRTRHLTTIRVSVSNSLLQLRLTDMAGSHRLILAHELREGFSPFRFSFGAQNALDVQKIMIWEKQSVQRPALASSSKLGKTASLEDLEASLNGLRNRPWSYSTISTYQDLAGALATHLAETDSSRLPRLLNATEQVASVVQITGPLKGAPLKLMSLAAQTDQLSVQYGRIERLLKLEEELTPGELGIRMDQFERLLAVMKSKQMTEERAYLLSLARSRCSRAKDKGVVEQVVKLHMSDRLSQQEMFVLVNFARSSEAYGSARQLIEKLRKGRVNRTRLRLEHMRLELKARDFEAAEKALLRDWEQVGPQMKGSLKETFSSMIRVTVRELLVGGEYHHFAALAPYLAKYCTKEDRESSQERIHRSCVDRFQKQLGRKEFRGAQTTVATMTATEFAHHARYTRKLTSSLTQHLDKMVKRRSKKKALEAAGMLKELLDAKRFARLQQKYSRSLQF